MDPAGADLRMTARAVERELQTRLKTLKEELRSA
jgi:hypothetical protein